MAPERESRTRKNKEKTMKKAYRLEWKIVGSLRYTSEDFDTMFEATTFLQALLTEEQGIGSITFRRRVGG